jgi:UDP-4-amino-4,6-dideoxy-N-acetyl-beta-L-altrosamine transaminase
MKLIPYGRQWVDDEDRKAVEAVLNSDWLTQGPVLKQFEDALCSYTGAKYAVAVANGTIALHLSLLALGVGKEDKVITSPITFAASASCAIYVGARPDFVDINDQTYHMDLNRLADYLKSPSRRKNVKVVIPVHFMGTVVDMKALHGICEPYGIRIVEDAAHALGASYINGKKHYKIGSCQHSDATIFSFHPIKHITTGEGGAVMTNDIKIYEALLKFRHHGIVRNSKNVSAYMKQFSDEPWFYDIPQAGYNFRLNDIQCALGVSQIKKIDAFASRRREMVARYNKAFSDVKEIRLPSERSGTTAAYHLYVIRVSVKKRNDLYIFLREQGIGTQINYIPVHLFSMYGQFGFRHGNFPVAEKYFEECLSLPLYPLLSDEGHQRIIECVRQFFNA